MVDQLNTEGASAPSSRPTWTPEQGVRLWIDLMETCDQLLVAGLEASLGPDGNLREAYRQWHAEKMREHDAMIFHMAQEFTERLSKHAS
ncbi:MAG: hypothetical protein NTY19_10820 [Planctomycetota bacterium]|nr:hypothetical protein [Planctomycetota bacterium]